MLAYLSRYTHRVAISNRRLIAADAKTVTFKIKDYRINGPARYKTMTLDAHEFIRRFLIHVLPTGFHPIRQYTNDLNTLWGSIFCYHKIPRKSHSLQIQAFCSSAVCSPSRCAGASRAFATANCERNAPKSAGTLAGRQVEKHSNRARICWRTIFTCGERRWYSKPLKRRGFLPR